MSTLNKIAILAVDLGGYDEAEKVLNVDADILAYAVNGGRLTDDQDALVEGAWLDLRRDKDLRDEYGIDLTEINRIDKEIENVQRALSDTEMSNMFRQAYAEGRVTADTLDSQGMDVFFDLTMTQARKVMDWLLENGHTADEFGEAYLSARDRIGGIYTVDETGSEWFEWLREQGISDSP